MGCKDYGETLSVWFMLNHFVNENDAESVRQFSTYLKSGGKTLESAKLEDLVPDKEKLRKILISRNKSYFIKKLKAEIPQVSFNGNSDDLEKSTYTSVNVCFPVAPEKGAMFLFQLDLKGIACSKGSACQSGSSQNSHVLAEILSEDDLLKPSIRFSFSIYNTKEEVDYVVKTLRDLVSH